MGKYLIKSADQRLMEAKSTSQLERLVVMGLLARDALVRKLPDGPWQRAEKHADTARFFRADENERTMIAVSPALLRRQASQARGEVAPADEAETFWVRTGVSTVEARGRDVLQRLFELGVVRAEHGVGPSPAGPFLPLAEHPLLAGLVERRRAARAGDEAPAHAGGDVSVVIALSDEEIEYFQDEVSQVRAVDTIRPRETRREVSNIIVLSGADLEILDDDDDLVVEVDLDLEEEAVVLSAADIEVLDDEPDELIELGVDDLEELEHIPTDDGLPTPDASWEQFCRAMNLAAQRITTRGHTQDLTWDLFRSMMERPRSGRSGPSESSWNRFQQRLQARRTGRTPLPTETTWDRFRELMAAPTQTTETTWNRFVRSIQGSRTGPTPASRRGRDVARQGGRIIAGEAQIKSDIVRVNDPVGPKVRIEGLKPSSDD